MGLLFHLEIPRQGFLSCTLLVSILSEALNLDLKLPALFRLGDAELVAELLQLQIMSSLLLIHVLLVLRLQGSKRGNMCLPLSM